MASVTRTAVKPLQGGVGYELSGGEEWAPEAVTVAWDGSGAAGNFVVAVTYYNDGGAVIDRAFPEGVTNAPGDTGRTFFRPFKRGAPASSGGGGIQFDTKPQAGGFLYTETSGDDGTGFGTHLKDTNNGQWFESLWDTLISSTHQLTARGVAATLEATGSDVQVVSDTNAFHVTGAAGISDVSTTDQLVIASNNLMQIQSALSSIVLAATLGFVFTSGTSFTVNLGGAGTLLQINDGAAAPLFEVRNDGSIHGRAAVGAITWDL